jgi:hypothetical protein
MNIVFPSRSRFHHFSPLLLLVFHLQVGESPEYCPRHINQRSLPTFNTAVVTVFHAITNLQQIRLYIIRPAITAFPQSSVEVHNALGADL